MAEFSNEQLERFVNDHYAILKAGKKPEDTSRRNAAGATVRLALKDSPALVDAFVAARAGDIPMALKMLIDLGFQIASASAQEDIVDGVFESDATNGSGGTTPPPRPSDPRRRPKDKSNTTGTDSEKAAPAESTVADDDLR